MSYQQALSKTRDAATQGSPGGMSTGEALMAALALNRTDWLQKMGYSIAEALERIGDDWAALVPRVAREIRKELALEAEAKEEAEVATAVAQMTSGAAGTYEDRLHFSTKLVTTGNAPGYRDASLVFELRPVGLERTFFAQLSLRPEDGESIVRHILDVHSFAWRDPQRGPLDRREGEQRPRWIDVRLD
jgi:hypothetical protein